MTLDRIVAEIKQRPGYAENVGMIMLHNGTVRAWSRKDHKKVLGVEVYANELKVAEICQDVGSMPGIFAVTAEPQQGSLKPGDNLLYLAVAGDVREHVLAAFEILLNRIKSEAVEKREILETP